MRNLFILWVFLALFIFQHYSFAQEPMEMGQRYFKRTIAYFDEALLVGSSVTARPSNALREYFAGLAASKINLPRFFWESLPETTVARFSKAAAGKRYESLDQIREDVQRYLAPEFVKILDLNKEIRALQLVSEADRNRFISTKAKTLGIDAQKLEKIMNSGYVVVPFIDKFTVKRDTITRVELSGGIVFFRVNFSNNEYSIKPSYEVKGDGKGSAKTSVDSAFMDASRQVIVSLEVAVREIFKLSAPILSTGFNSVSFELGRREGILVDDGFDVFEFVQTRSGQIKPKNVGFVRVTRVADNRKRKAASKAQIIIGALIGEERIASGMFVQERPRFPFDLVSGVSISPVNLQTGVFKLGEKIENIRLPENDTLKINKGKLLAYSGRISVNYNYGRHYRIPQLWFTIDGNLGVLPVDIEFFGKRIKSAIFASLNLGFMKKIYFRRLALAFELKSGISNFKLSYRVKEEGYVDTTTYALSLRKWVIGGGPGGGVEFVLNPDVNIGARVFYWYTESTDRWSFLKEIGKDEKRKEVKLAPVHMRGLIYQVYLNISIKNFAKVKKLE